MTEMFQKQQNQSEWKCQPYMKAVITKILNTLENNEYYNLRLARSVQLLTNYLNKDIL